MTPETLQQIAKTITQAQEARFTPVACDPVYGGDINQSFVLRESSKCYFVKTNQVERLPLFQTERRSLDVLRAAHALLLPRPIALGTTGDCAFLVLEFHRMRSRGDSRKLAQGLVKLHRQSSPDGRFGWDQDNFIGTSVQHNQWRTQWSDFWLEQRLLPQLTQACDAGYGDALQPLAQQLQVHWPDIWGDYSPRPSLLHGDLWSGNAAYLESGEPIIYDPASYYGDRETDLALTELFGGFPDDFYQEYQRLWPLEAGYTSRKQLYNLYHLLNHLNLFGDGYLSRCRSILKQLTSL